MDIFNDVLNSARYNPKVRPLWNQTKTMYVVVRFQLLSIVELDDVQQSFACNGFLGLVWEDEMLKWDKDKYGGQDELHPVPEDIWRPRVVIMNTLGDRDPFGDVIAPVFVYSNGSVSWVPGTLLTTSCKLDLTDYPFDQQNCTVQIVAMTLTTKELTFVASTNKSSLNFFTSNSEWNYLDSSLTTSYISTGTRNLSSIDITFFMKRRPMFLLINIILPVVFLSFLNLLVFVIPVESGEKIGYGITVLLALSVYMSIVSSLLPSSSLTTPKLTLYLFILLIISMLTVIDSIIIVFLHNLEEKAVVHFKAQENFKSAFSKVKNLQRAVTPATKMTRNTVNGKQSLANFKEATSCSEEAPPYSSTDMSSNQDDNRETPRRNKYKMIGKHIDAISFVVFFFIWISVTLGFLFNISF
ncbi:neuronal acetylcholine receptor subunit alpha-6-like [Physella acuta]|uniref:neuronal acetylcholine receptor subunit alpha-6-like n=1 Tax=Physella acuta TaxID=109671 RepID=UPI0027DE6879|nr:neuronal acetylcholine receptor subunit alpha-6-like [Physella acuta]